MIEEDELIACVGARLKQLRYAAGLTQHQMAKRIDCGLRNYQRLETGTVNMSLRTVARLAEALEVSPMEFFERFLPAPRPLTVSADAQQAHKRRQRG